MSGTYRQHRPWGGGGGGKTKRAGPVTYDGKCFRDDLGVFDPLGTSFFWAGWGWKHDRPRTEQNMDDIAPWADVARIFGEVGGDGWEDRTIDPADPDWLDNMGACIDALWRGRGVRVYFTVFATGKANVDATIDKVIALIRPRLDAFLCVEVSNESKLDKATMRRAAQQLRAAFPSLPVATTAPYAPPAEHGWTNADFDTDVCTLGTVHPERDRGDEDWRQVRQGCEIMGYDGLFACGEPAGFESSGEVLHDPLRLAALRRVSELSGMTCHIHHTGAGIRGGGQADQDRGRAANFWEYDGSRENRPSMAAAVAAYRACDGLMPSDAPDWSKFKGHWAEARVVADAIWSDNPAAIDHGCVRVYGGYTGDQFAAVCFGIRRWVDLTLRFGPWRVEVYDVLTGARLQSGHVDDGGVIRVDGDANVWGSAPNEAGSSKAVLLVATR